MLIQSQPLQHWIENFYGYGSWNARIWFVGFEEGGGDLPEEVAEKLNYFYERYGSSNQPILCDIRELYERVTVWDHGTKSDVFTNLYENRFGANAKLHGGWKNLIAFVHGYRSETIPDLLTYQKSSFTHPSAHEALIQLYPLPSPHNHAWYYAWVDLPEFSFLKSRTGYQDHVYPRRISGILENIKRHRPDVVVLYGMDNINKLKESVCEFFPAAKFKMNKAIKLQIPQHHRANLDGTAIVITTQMPTLRHNRIETGFDWQQFGKAVRSEI